MKKQTAEVFHALMKKGWIDRSESTELWRCYEDPDVQEEMEVMGDELGFELVRSMDRCYLVPTQDNDLFLKNNADFRRDINSPSELRRNDLYLMNYLAIYMIYLFYHGEGADPRCREFISREDMIREFSEHCRACIKGAQNSEQTDYSENFLQLANSWLSRTDGDRESIKMGERCGIVNRLLIKFNAEHDDLFYREGENIRPTRKLNDLMPYFLRKDRIAQMQEWVREVNEHAADL